MGIFISPSDLGQDVQGFQTRCCYILQSISMYIGKATVLARLVFNTEAACRLKAWSVGVDGVWLRDS